MDVLVVCFAVVVLLSNFIRQGEAQVDCYPDEACDDFALFSDVNSHFCCMQTGSMSFQRDGHGESCRLCFVYGWVDNFPKKVSRGDVLNLKVGYLKGIPDIRRTVTVIFNNTEVNVNATSFVLLRTPTNVMVTVLGDRPPVSENVTITLTLQYDNVGSDDIFLDTAQLVIPQVTYTARMERSTISVSEDVGTVRVCAVLTSNSPLTFPLSPSVFVTLRTASATSKPYEESYGAPMDYVHKEVELEFRDSDTVCENITIIDDDAVERDRGTGRENFFAELESRSPNVRIGGSGTTEISIEDNDVVTIRHEHSFYTVSEDVGSFKVCAEILPEFNQTCPIAFNATVALSTVSDIANSPDDYLPLSALVPIPGCKRNVCADVVIKDDSSVELTETFFIKLERGPFLPLPGVPLNVSYAVVTLLDSDDDMATVGLVETMYNVSEEEGNLTICINKSGSVSFPFNLTFTTTDGTAKSPIHYTSVSKNVTINPEHMQRCETIEIKNVTEDDGTVDESVNFSIHLEEPYNHDKRIKVEPDEGTVIIRDQDVAQLGLDVNPQRVTEGDEVVVCLVSLSPSEDLCRIKFVFNVNLSCSNCGNDVCTVLSYDPANCKGQDMADTDQCCRINIEDDSSVEKEVNITVGFIQPLQLPPNIKLQKEAEVISIVDNDVAVVGFEETVYRASEEIGMIDVCVVIKSEADCPVTFPFEVDLSTVAGSAEEESDYIAVTSPLMFPQCHMANYTNCMTITIVSNTQTEALETFNVTLSGVEFPGIVLSPSEALIVITDEAVPRIGIEEELYTVSEDDGVLELCVVVFAPFYDCSKYIFQLSSTNDTAGDGVDYVSVNTTLNACQQRNCVNITIRDNDKIHATTSKSFNLELMLVIGELDQQIGIHPSTSQVTINDDENVLLGLDINPQTVTEGEEVMVCLASLSPPQGLCSITFVFYINITCSNCDDDVCRVLLYDPTNCNSRDLADTDQCCRINIEDDSSVENEKIITIKPIRSLELPMNIELQTEPQVISIMDNDMAVVGFEETVYRASEEIGMIDVCVVIESDADCPITFPFEVVLSTVAGSAEEESDYIAVTSTLMFPQCHMANTPECRTITIVSDTQTESLETFNVTLSGVLYHGIVLNHSEAIIVITDEAVPRIGIEEEIYAVSEDANVLEVCVVVFAPFFECSRYIFRLSSTNDTAVDGVDYVSVNTTLNACHQRNCVNITIKDNDKIHDTPSKSFYLELMLVMGEIDQQINVHPNISRVTINDNENALLGLDVNPQTVTEGEEVVVCLASLSPPQALCNITFVFNVNLTCSNCGKDVCTVLTYDPANCNSQDLADTEQCCHIPIEDDSSVENETILTVGLIQPLDLPINIKVQTEQQVISIMDNDVAVVGFEETVYRASEEIGMIDVCVVIESDADCPVTFPFEVDLSTVAGSAEESSDYIAVTSTLMFPVCHMANLPECMTVTIVSDTQTEALETFNVTLSGVLFPGIVISPSEALIVITDEAVPRIGIEEEVYTVSEDDGVLEVCVVVFAPFYECSKYIFRLSSTNGTAGEGLDYVSVNTNLSACQQRNCVNITIRDNNKIHTTPSKSFNLELMLVMGEIDQQIRIHPNISQVTINDNENVLLGLDINPQTVTEGEEVVVCLASLSPPQALCSITFVFNVNLTCSNCGKDVCTVLTYDPANCNSQDLADTEQCCHIPIEDDSSVENETILTVGLIQPLDLPINIKVQTEQQVISIMDNDMALVGFEETVYRASEEIGMIDVCVVIESDADCPVTFPFEVDLSTVAGSAEESSDYIAVTSTLLFPVCHMANLPECMTITIVSDTQTEALETFNVTLSGVLHPGIVLSPSEALIVITDEAVPRIGIEEELYTVSEDDGVLEVCVVVFAPFYECSKYIFQLSSTNGTAGDGVDYVSVNTNLSACQQRNCVNITIRDNDKLHATTSKTFHLELMLVMGEIDQQININPDSAQVIINDDENALLGLDVNPQTVTEGEEVVVCLASLSPPQGLCNITFMFNVYLSCSNCDNDVCTVLTYDPANCNSQDLANTDQCCHIPIEDDRSVENETIVVGLVRPMELPMNIELQREPQVISIVDNDVAVVGFDETVYRASEEIGMIDVCVVIESDADCPVTFPFEVELSTVAGSAEEGSDYIAVTSTLMFPVCHMANLPKCTTITIVSDAQTEAIETFNVTLSGVLYPGIELSPSEAVIVITDEAVPRIGIEEELYTVSEDDGVLEVCVVVFAPFYDCSQYIFLLSSTNDTAGDGVDYVSVNTTLNACKESTCVNIIITDNEKLHVTPSKSFYLELMLVMGEIDQQIDIHPHISRVTIYDNEMVIVNLEETEYRIDENAHGPVEVCAITSVQCVPFNFQVLLSTFDGTAESESDYYGESNVAMNFEECLNRQCWFIDIIEDRRLEEEENFFVSIEKAVDGDSRVKLNSVTAQVIITDRSNATTVDLTSTHYQVLENAATVEICAVVQSEGTACPIETNYTLHLSTMDGTAVASMDYGAPEMLLMFGLCVTQSCVSLPIKDDGVLEYVQENFTVHLAHSYELATKENLTSRILLGVEEATVAIRDDEPDVVLSLQTPDKVVSQEEAKMLNVCVTLTGPIDFPFSFFLVIGYEEAADEVLVKVNRANDIVCTQVNISKTEVQIDEIKTITIRLQRTPDLDERIVLNEDTLKVYITGNGNAVKCFTRKDCSGPFEVSISAKECCIGNEISQSYQTADMCKECVVHGFSHTMYNVIEGSRLNVTFQGEVKGTTQFDGVPLPLRGTIMSEAVTADSQCDYEDIGNVKVDNDGVAEISLLTINDDITLEYNDTVKLKFESLHGALFKDELEKAGEFIRDVAYVEIIDNDNLEINFDKVIYAVNEEGTPTCNVRLEHRKTQGHFTVHFESVSVEEAMMRLGGATEEETISSPFHATQGKDFMQKNVSITILPTMKQPTPASTYDVHEILFDIVEDNINEYTQSFVLLASITLEAELKMTKVCFQESMMGKNCSGIGSVEVRILDNDPMVIGFASRGQAVGEDAGDVYITVHSNTVSEMDHAVEVVLLTSSTNASVLQKEGAVEILDTTDALFGSSFVGHIQHYFNLRQGLKAYNLTATIIDDDRPECSKCFTLRLSAEPDILGRRDLFSCNNDNTSTFFCYYTLCIMDDCAEPCEVGFDRELYTVYENETFVEVCVDLTCPGNGTNTVSVEVFRDDSIVDEQHALANGTYPSIDCTYMRADTDDYEEQIRGCNQMRDVVIEQGMTKCHRQPIYDDVYFERTEYTGLSLEIKTRTAPTNIIQGHTQIKIVDTDMAIIGFTKTAYVVEEGKEVDVCVEVKSPNVTCPFDIRIDVQLSTMDDTAMSGEDYVERIELVMLEKCQLKSCMTVATLEDGTADHSKVFKVILSRASLLGSRIQLERNEVIVTINDNDVAIVRPIRTSYIVDEDIQRLSVCLLIEYIDSSRQCPYGYRFEVSMYTMDGTAEHNRDYQSQNASLMFMPHSQNCDRIECVDIAILDDETVDILHEENFTVAMSIDSELYPNIRLDGTHAVVTIRDDETKTFGLLDAPYCEVRENGTDIQLCVGLKLPYKSIHCPVDFTFYLHLSIISNKEGASSDFNGTSTILTIPHCHNMTCLHIPIIDDRTVELIETFNVVLQRTEGLDARIILEDTIKEVAIIDDDVVTIGFNNKGVAVEGEVARVCAVVKGPSVPCPAAFSFDLLLTTSNADEDSAIAGRDYTPITVENGLMTFETCAAEVCWEIHIVANERVENTKYFILHLEKVEENDFITIEAPEKLFTIFDNSTAMIELEPRFYELQEGSNVIVCAVVNKPTILCPIFFPFDITVETKSHTAVSPEDYEAVSTTLSFRTCNIRHCFRIYINDDCLVEDSEGFMVQMKRTRGLDSRILLSSEAAVVNITDNDNLYLGLSQALYVVEEDTGYVEVCITSTGESCYAVFPFELHIRTAFGSADTTDLDPLDGIVRFSRQQSQRCINVTIEPDEQVEMTESFDVVLDETADLNEQIILTRRRASVIITNDDTAVVGFQKTSETQFEDGHVTVCVQVFSPDIRRPVAYPFEIAVTTADISAAAELDYIPPDDTLRFSAGELRDCFDIQLVDDRILEEDIEIFNVRVMATEGSGNDIIFSRDTLEVRIVDDDVATVGLEQSVYTVTEGQENIRVCIEVQNSQSDQCLITFPFNITITTLDGSAVSLLDFEAKTITVNFAPCQLYRCIEVVLSDDCVVEALESFHLVLTTPSYYVNERINVNSGYGEIFIIDDDSVTVGLQHTSYTVSESVGSLYICAVIFQCHASFEFSVSFNTSDDSADSPADFAAVSTLLTFEQSQRRLCVTVTIENDSVLEQREAFTVHLGRSSGLNDRIHVLTSESLVIIDNDDEAMVGLELEECEIDENVGEMDVCLFVFTPELDCPILFPFEMNFYTTPGTAKLNEDYSLDETVIRFDACERRKCLMVPIVDDLLLENTENFTIHLEKSLGLSNEFIVEPSVKVINIVDNDVATVGFDSTAYTVLESDGVLRVCATVTIPSVGCPVNTAFTINLRVERGTAGYPDDYDAPSSVPMEFSACSRQSCANIDIVSSEQVEAVETFSLLLVTSQERLKLHPNYTTVDIIDDRTRAVVDLQDARLEVTEGDGGVPVCAVIRSPDITCPVDFTFTISLSVGDDNLPIVFAACDQLRCVDVAIDDDNRLEKTERVSIALERPEDLDNRIIIGYGKGEIIITDDPTDEAIVGFQVLRYSIEEGSVEIAACIQVHSPSDVCPIDFSFTVTMTTRDGTAESPSDYRAVSKLVTMPPCQTLKCEAVVIVNDVVLEETETFSIGLYRTANLDPRLILAPVNSTVQIVDRDIAVVGLKNTAYSVSESAAVVMVCIEVRSPSATCPIMFPFSLVLATGSGSAREGLDYNGDSHTVDFQSCQRRLCVDIAIVDDEEVEDTEWFSVSLLRQSGTDTGITIEPAAGQINILDHDNAVVGMMATAYQVAEDAGVMHVCFRVQSTASCVIPFPISITVSTRTDSAGSDDYTFESSETSLSPCQPRKCVEIAITDDTLVEGDEKFRVSLSNLRSPEGDRRITRVRINPSQAQVTINDDDSATVRLVTDSYQVRESDRSLRVCAFVQSPVPVSADCPVDFSFQVNLVSADGTAVSSEDYSRVSTTLYFQRCAEEYCSTVSISNDNVMEPEIESFTVALENSAADTRLTVSSQPSTIHIEDDDGAVIGLERSAYTITEREGAVQVVCAVVKSPGSSCPIKIPVALHLSTQDNTADTPSDYVAAPTTVTFEECDRRQCFDIAITDDQKVEKKESLIVLLNKTAHLDSRLELERVTSTVVITDTDTATVQLESESITVDEGIGSFNVCVVVNEANGCSVQFGFNVSFSASGTAVINKDYTGMPTTKEFPACQRRMCVPVFILDDSVVENQKTIRITMRSGNPQPERISFSSRATTVQLIDNDVAVVGLERLYVSAREGARSAEVCAIVEAEGSVSFQFYVRFMFTPDSATRPHDFNTDQTRVTFYREQSRKCTNVAVVDSADVEMPESLIVRLELDNTYDSRIRLNEDRAEGEVEILDDDEAVVGLERTSYQLQNRANSVEVCVSISQPTTSCPITFPFDMIFRLVEPAPDIFKVPVSQSPRPEGGIEDDNNNDRRDVILLFNSCQRRICFSVHLRAGVSRPNRGETFGIRIERTPDHGRTTILDEDRTSGIIRIGLLVAIFTVLCILAVANCETTCFLDDLLPFLAVDTIRGDLTEVTGVCSEPDHVGYSVVNTGTTVRFLGLNNRLGDPYCFGFIVNRDPNPLDGPPLAIFYDGVNIVGNLTVTANGIIYRIRDAEAVFAGLETLGYNHYQLCTNHTDVTLYDDCVLIDSQSFSHEGFGDLSFVGFLKDVLSADAAGFGGSIAQLYFLSCSSDHVLQEQIASVQCIARNPLCADQDATIPVQSALDSIFPIVSEITCSLDNLLPFLAVDTIRGDLTEVTGVCNEPDHVGYSVVNTGTTVRFIDLNNRLGGQYCFGFIVNRDPNPLDGPPLAIFYDGVNIVGNLTVTANSIIYRIRDAEAVFAGLETLGYNHYQLCTNHTDVTLYNDCGFIDSQSFSHEGFGDLSFVGFLKDVLSADAAGFGGSIAQLYFLSCSSDHVLQDQIASVQCIARNPLCADQDATIPVQSALDSIFPIVSEITCSLDDLLPFLAVDTIRGDLTEVTGICNEPDHVGYSVVNTGTTVRFIDLNNRLGGQYCFGFIVNRDPNPLDGPPLAIFYDGVNIVGNLTVTANSIIYRIRDAEAVFAGLETLGYNHYQLCTNHTDVTLYNDCGFIDSQSFSHEGFGDLSFVGFLKDVLSADAAGFGGSIAQLYFLSCSNDHVLQDQIASVQCIARPPECAGHDETIPVQSALDSIFPIVPTVGLTQTIYHVMEDEGMAEVCIAVMGSLVPYPFHIIFTVKDGSPMNGTYMTQEIIFEPFDSEECIAIEIAVGKLMGMDVYFNITLTRSDGLDDRIKLEPAEGVVVIAENEKIITCSGSGISEVEIDCGGIGSGVTLQCSFNQGPQHPCSLPLVLNRDVSPPGTYSVRIVASTGGIATVEYTIMDTNSAVNFISGSVPAEVPPLGVYLMNGSPRVTESSVEAEFEVTRPVAGVRCFLRSKTSRTWKECSSGQVSFSNLKPGRYVLKIQAYNRNTDMATAKRGFVVMPD